MLKLLLLLTTLLGLGYFAYNLIEIDQQKDSFNNNPHTQFAVNNIEEVTKVFLADRRGNQALIEKINAEEWSYTNKITNQQYLANPSAIYSLLQTISKIRTREPVSKAAEENVIKSISSKSTKVEIYNNENKKIKVYYVGPMAGGATGNYMIMEGAEQPYINYIPNFQGTIDTRYITTEEDWRDKAFVRTKTDKLEFIQVNYMDPSQEAESFKIIKKENRFVLEPLSDKTVISSSSSLNQDNAATYFEDFETVFAEKILFDKRLRDSIITTRPFAIISYKASYHKEPKVFRLYSLYNPKADRGDGLTGHRQKIQRYFIDLDENNFFLGQHLVIRKILWGYSFFNNKEAIILAEDEAETIIKYPDNKEEERALREEKRQEQN